MDDIKETYHEDKGKYSFFKGHVPNTPSNFKKNGVVNTKIFSKKEIEAMGETIPPVHILVSKPDKEQGTIRERVIGAFLEHNDWISTVEMAELLGLEMQQVSVVFSDMHNFGGRSVMKTRKPGVGNVYTPNEKTVEMGMAKFIKKINANARAKSKAKYASGAWKKPSKGRKVKAPPVGPTHDLKPTQTATSAMDNDKIVALVEALDNFGVKTFTFKIGKITVDLKW